MENSHDDPYNYFSVRARDAPDDSVGVAHSHPVHRPEPSDHDLDGIPTGWIGAVLLPNGDVAWYVKNRPVRPHLRCVVR